MDMTWKVCSICQKYYDGWGNNAWPVNDGRCCDDCNRIVLVARINQIQRRDEDRLAKAEEAK